MIFDDHEVTDDWNLNKHNHDQLLTNPMSRRAQANALAAYWACQGWGNDPSAFTMSERKQWTDFLQTKSANGAQAFERSLLEGRNWGYELACNPPVVVLDTRTQRDFSGDGSAALITSAGLKRLGKTLSKLSGPDNGDTAKKALFSFHPPQCMGSRKSNAKRHAGWIPPALPQARE